jgi:hypothetical protein
MMSVDLLLFVVLRFVVEVVPFVFKIFMYSFFITLDGAKPIRQTHKRSVRF